uniref:Uncharacterized protein n=1 Tax=Graphocephala atropunctata TaxID=36148 RepID=A0A1B6LUA1_9HEMI
MFSSKIVSMRSVLRLTRTYSAQSGAQKPPASKPATSSSSDFVPKSNVTGLSANCVASPSGEVGPGASKSAAYKNPEYFCYHNTSYFEAEVEMSKYRLPQPSPFKN